MATVSLTFLGAFQALRSDALITHFNGTKARALLAYLAVENDRPQARAKLAALLWPDQGDELALRNLAQALVRLRGALGDTGALLDSTRHTIQWRGDDAEVDVLTFRRLLGTADPLALARATELYGGDFLAGFSAPGCEAFDEWLMLTREQLQQQALAALHTLVELELQAGRFEAAARAARRQLALDPWREAAQRQLMRALAGAGDRAAALAVYDHGRQTLRDELGVEPDLETATLAEHISAGNLAPATVRTPAPAHRLPAPLTPFVGRERELAELAAQMRTDDVRLLTLVGAGGMGKTRLALELVRKLLASPAHDGGAAPGAAPWPAFPDGVFFVALAPLTTAGAIAPAIAAAIGLDLHGDPTHALLSFVRDKRLLLLLDNVEHLLGPGPSADDAAGELVVGLLGAAPCVQLIATSRERLNVRGEHVYLVDGMEYATQDATPSAAVRLFTQSARRALPGFELSEATLGHVLRICRLVGGMPLGLELAAAWVETVPLDSIAAEIERSAAFLQFPWRDAPERQRSMRAVFDWSWRLLNDAERRTVRGLSVFRGGCTRDAAQTVIDAPLQVLTRLTHKSMLRWVQPHGGQGRYEVHELIRQFAAAELDAAGERAAVEASHSRYYLAYVAARGRRLGRGEPREASGEILAELDNVRRAWQWAVAHARLAELEQATYAWWQCCEFAGLELDGQHSFGLAVEGLRRHLARLTAAGGDAAALPAQRLLARLLAIHAYYLVTHGSDEDMVGQASEAVSLGAASGGVEGETWGTFVLGLALQNLGHKQAAGEQWQRTIELVRRYQGEHSDSDVLHEAHWKAHVLLRGTALNDGDYAASRAHMVQALQICQTLGKRWAELDCLVGLAGTDWYLYNVAAAEAGFAAARELARSLGFRRAAMDAEAGLSDVLRLRGEYATSRTLLEQALSTASELVSPYDEALMLAALVRLHSQLGDQAAAAQRLDQLTQLLARVNLGKECQLYRYLAAATVAQGAGAAEAALQYAEQAEQVNRQGGDILFRLVDTALILGHARAGVGQWDAATAAFQQALAAFERFGNRALAAEPRAGLAQIALAQGDLAAAQAHIDAVLPVLAEQPHAGYTDPMFIYLTGYRVLDAAGDIRAGALLQQGYDLLHQDAAALDETSRRRFLGAVPVHRNLVAAYGELQARADTVTKGW